MLNELVAAEELLDPEVGGRSGHGPRTRVERSSLSTNTLRVLQSWRSLGKRSKSLQALCDQGVVSIANFLTGVAIGRMAGKEELGLYAVSWTIIAALGELSSALITTPYTVFSPRMDERTRGLYLGGSLIHHLVLALVVALAMLVGVSVASWSGLSHKWVKALAVTAAVVVMVSLREFVRRECFATMNLALVLELDSCAAISQLIGIGTLAASGHLTAATAYVVLGVVSLAVVSWWLFLNRKRITLESHSWLPTFIDNWRFSKWVLASIVLWTVSTYMYPWTIMAIHGPDAVGVWAACSAVVATGNPIFGGLGAYIGPRIATVYAHSGFVAMRRCVHKAGILFVVLLSPLLVILLLAGSKIVSGLYGASYGKNGGVLAALGITLVLTAFTYPYARGLLTVGAARADMFINLVAVVLLFGVGFRAIHSYALAGAASAMLLSTAVTAGIRYVVFVRATAPLSR